MDGHYHALPLTDVLHIHKRKCREPGKVEYGTAIYRCPVLLGQISVAARSLLSLAAIIIIIIISSSSSSSSSSISSISSSSISSISSSSIGNHTVLS